MEFVDGTDTSKLCAYFEMLSVPDACEIVRQAEALKELSARYEKAKAIHGRARASSGR